MPRRAVFLASENMAGCVELFHHHLTPRDKGEEKVRCSGRSVLWCRKDKHEVKSEKCIPRDPNRDDLNIAEVLALKLRR